MEYVFSGATRACVACKEAKLKSFIILGVLGLFGFGSVFMFATGTKLPHFLTQNRVAAFARSLDAGSVKVVWATYQIVAATSVSLDITYPEPFASMLGFMSVFSLDFISLECYQRSADRYFNTVYAYSIGPLVVSVAILVLGGVRLLLVASAHGGVEAANKVKSQHLWMFLFLTYIVLPPVAMKQLQSLNCYEYDHRGMVAPMRYLRVDTGIDCDSDEYIQFRKRILVFIFLYQLIPLLWYRLLRSQRSALNPPVSKADATLGIYIRDKDVSLNSLRFLFSCYKCESWWFEVAEMYRRMVFVSAIPLASPVPATRASLGCVLSIASMMYYRETQPFTEGLTNFIAYMSQLVVFLTFYAALGVETGVIITFGMGDLGIGIFLFAAVISILLLTVLLAGKKMSEDRATRNERYRKAMALEDAAGFSSAKFKATCDAANVSAVSANHALVFYYTSLHGARACLRSGVPAHEKNKGVIVTFRRPHDISTADVALFSSSWSFPPYENSLRPRPFEAAVALIVQKRLLHPVPGHESDDCIRLIPAHVLVAMRPPSGAFGTVLDPRPWADGVLLLPPAAILRAYQLIPHDCIADRPGPNGKLRLTNGRRSSAADVVSNTEPNRPDLDAAVGMPLPPGGGAPAEALTDEDDNRDPSFELGVFSDLIEPDSPQGKDEVSFAAAMAGFNAETEGSTISSNHEVGPIMR